MEKFKIISFNNNDGYYKYNLYCNIHHINYNVSGDYKHCKAVFTSNSCGCPMCNPTTYEAKQFRNNFKINLLTEYDLFSMHWTIIYDLIGLDKLPKEFECLCKFKENTPSRKKIIEDLIKTYNIEVFNNEEYNENKYNDNEELIEKEENNIENEENIYEESDDENELKPYKENNNIGRLLNNDNDIFSTGDKLLHIMHKQINKIWTLIFRDDENHSTKNIEIIKSKLKSNDITKFERYIYEEFLKEYNEVINQEIH